MATPQGFASSGGFVPEIWANRGLDILKPLLGVTRRIARDTNFTDAFQVGSKINVPIPGRMSAPRKGAATNVTVQTPRAVSELEVTLAYHRTCDFLVYDVTRAQANPGLMQTLMETAVAGLARAIEQDVIATLMTGSNSNGTAGSDLSAATFRTAMSRVNDRLMPVPDRSFAISPKDHAALLGDSELRGYFNFQSEEALREGRLGALYGFDTFMTQLAPATAVQRLNFSGGSNGQTFRLVWNGFETGDIVFDTTAATLVSNIQTALRALSEPIQLGASTVSVSGGAITAIDVTFANEALRYPSSLTLQTEGVAGTPFAGTCTIAPQGTVTTTNLMFHRYSAVFCPRAFAEVPQGQGVVVSTIIDDDERGTGIPMRVMGWYDGDARAYRVGLDVLYGVGLARDSQVQRVLS